MRLALILGMLLALAPATALAADDADESAQEDTAEDEGETETAGPVNPYEIIEADPALKTHGWIALSIGAAALIAGGVTGSVALAINADLEDKCSGDQCPPSQHDRLDRRNALATSSTALIASGFAMAMVGLLVLTAFAPDEEEDTAAEGSSATLLPLAGPHLAGAAVEWRF